MNTLKAEKRSLDVKAKRLRREGYVVGNVFGREMKESIPVKMVKKRCRETAEDRPQRQPDYAGCRRNRIRCPDQKMLIITR